MRYRRILLLILMLAVAALLEFVLGRRLVIFYARPDIVLLLVVTNSVVRGTEEGLLGGIAGGLIVDCLSAAPFGTATIGLGLIGFATGLGESNVFRANFLIPLGAVFMSTVVYHSIIMLALQGTGWSVEWIGTLALQTIPGAFINALLAPLAFPLVRRVLLAGESKEQVSW